MSARKTHISFSPRFISIFHFTIRALEHWSFAYRGSKPEFSIHKRTSTLSTHEKIGLVSEWLTKNTKSFETPKALTLFDFAINKMGYSGHFYVMLDDIIIKSKFRFGLSANGKPEVYLPMFHSPLGAPASYASVALTDETEQAIKDLLASVLPTMKALGLDKETGEWITAHSVEHRIVDRSEFDQKMAVASNAGFKVLKSFNANHPRKV